MNAIIEDPLAQGIVLQATLPMRWRVLDAPLDEHHLILMNDRNESTLRLVHALGSYHVDVVADDSPGTTPELAHLQFKVDLILEMVGELLAKQVQMPEQCSLRMTSSGLEWSDPSPPPQDSSLLVELYLSLQCPRGIDVPARVVRVDESGSLAVSFESLGEPVKEWLERVIFQHHRREVAQSRQSR